MGDVAVIVPTLRRPESLERALRSLFAQTGVADRLAAVVVVDNDPTGSAAATVDSLRGQSPWALTYVHAPQRRDDDGDVAHQTASAYRAARYRRSEKARAATGSQSAAAPWRISRRSRGRAGSRFRSRAAL